MHESIPTVPERTRLTRFLLLLLVLLYIPLVHTVSARLFPALDGGSRLWVAALTEWSLFALLFCLLRFEGLHPHDMWLTSEHVLREIILGLTLTLFFWLAVLLVVRYGLIAGIVPGADHIRQEGYGLRFSIRLPPLNGQSVVTLAVAVTAGVCEEVIFRGYILSRARQLFASRWVGLLFALLLSSVFFGLLHLPMGIGGFAMAMFGGFCCSVLVLWRGNLTSAMVAHILFNLKGWYLT